MKIKNLILVAILICTTFILHSCKKDKSTTNQKSSQSVLDSSDLHLVANVSDGTSIQWDANTSTITHSSSSIWISHGSGEQQYSQAFNIQNSNGSGFSTDYEYRSISNPNSGVLPEQDIWQFIYKGKTYQSNLLIGQNPITSTTYQGTILHNGQQFSHFKGYMKFYISNPNNIPIDSIMLTNVDWVYAY